MTTFSNGHFAPELKRVLQRYQALSNTPGMVVWGIDRHFNPTLASEGWERYTGQSPAEYGGHGWMAALHPDDRPQVQEVAARALASREAVTTEIRILRADGVFRRNIVRAVPVFEGTEIVEWIGTAIDVEDARRTADDLAAVEQRLRIAHAAAGVGTWEWHIQRNELSWSPEIFQLLGLAPTDPSADLWTDRLHPDDREASMERWNEALHGGAMHFSDTFRIVRPDGSIRWIVSSAVIFRLPDGEPVRAVGLNLDVTGERRLQEQMEEALAEARDVRARLLELTEEGEALLASRDEPRARAGVLALAQRILPADAYAVWWYDSASATWSIVESVGLSPRFTSERVKAEPPPSIQPIVSADAQSDASLSWRREAYQAEGIRSLLTIPLPIRGERRATLVAYYRSPHAFTETELRVGRAMGQIAAAVLANAEFNAAQDRARAAAQRHASRMAYLADASAVLGSLDYEATLQQIARMAVPAISDWCAVDLADPGGTLHRIVTAHDDPAMIDLARRLEERYPTPSDSPAGVPGVMRTGIPELYEHVGDDMLAASARDEEHLRILRELGIRSVFIAPLVARGRTLGAMTFVISTGDRTFSQEDATVLTEVARRAALAIENARLYREVETANRLKDEFLAVLSHELRTPLNAIMGWTHMLRQGLSPETQAHAFEVINRNAHLQKQLVEDLLDVARIAAGRLDLDRQPLDLCEAARSAVDSVLPAADAQQITVTLACTTPSVIVLADAQRLQQVAANILGNALKFSDRGGAIRVEVCADERCGELVVQDTGAGIAPEFLPLIFDRFRQADSSLTRAYQGLGLGLWVVKQIVDAHGGEVRAESSGPRTGTRITVRLPLA